MVIDRLCALDKPFILLEDLKWVVLMVLFNVPGSEQAYAQMEDLIFDEPLMCFISSTLLVSLLSLGILGEN